MTKTEFLKALKNPIFYIENFVKIRDKKGKVVLLKLKPAQKRLRDAMKEQNDAGKPIRIVILKARQLGFSTIIEALFFQDAATREEVRTLIVAHEEDSTSNLFRMNKGFFDWLPDQIKPMRKASNAKELLFENPTKDPAEKIKNPGLRSSIKCVPATGGKVGRSSTLTNVHASEAAFWDRMYDTFDALFQAVPAEQGTAIIIETTPNGFNEFKDFWDKTVAGENDFIPLFFPWFEEPEYRMPVPPGFTLTEEEEKLQNDFGLDLEQLAWRRWKIANDLHGDVDKFKQEYPLTPEECFLMSGNPYFDNQIIIDYIRDLKSKPERGRFEFETDENFKPANIVWQRDDRGEIYLYEMPKDRFPYVIGGDTAGDGSDRFTAHIIDNASGDQVAQLLYDGGSELWYAQQIYCLAEFYNRALTGIEINFSTYPEKKLEEWGDTNLFIRHKVDDSREMLDTYKLGWKTDLRTRPLCLGILRTVLAENIDMIRSEELLREALTFIKNKDMRPEAAQGKHDDLVMAAAICYAIRDQQRTEEIPEEEIKQEKLIDKLKKRKK